MEELDLDKLPRRMPYTVPEGTFDAIERSVLEAIAREQQADQVAPIPPRVPPRCPPRRPYGVHPAHSGSASLALARQCPSGSRRDGLGGPLPCPSSPSAPARGGPYAGERSSRL